MVRRRGSATAGRMAVAGVASLLGCLACATAPTTSPQGPTRARKVRILRSVYELPSSVSVNVLTDVPGFQKLQYVNADTQCTGVWLFNAVDTRDAHERYVRESVDKPMARSLAARTQTSGGVAVETLL